MKSITRIFAAVALAGSLATGAYAQQQQPGIQGDPVQAFDNTPTCLSFEHPDRAGVKFPDAALHQYDPVMKKFAGELQSYSGWNDMAARLKKGGAPLNGVCVYAHGENEPPVSYDSKMGSIDINIYKPTPWGDSLQTPQEVEKSLDLMLHFATFALNANVEGASIAPPILTPETAAFMRAVVIGNSHAEAVLATVERGLDENRLDDLEPILFKNSPLFKDEIALLYNKVKATGKLTDADRKEFKTAVLKNILENPGRRASDFKATAALMQQLAKQHVNIAQLFNLDPEKSIIDGQLTARYGKELTDITIGGKSLQEAYKDFWAANPNDPATPIKAQLDQFRKYVGDVFARQAAEEAKKKAQQKDQDQVAPVQPAPQLMPSQ